MGIDQLHKNLISSNTNRLQIFTKLYNAAIVFYIHNYYGKIRDNYDRLLIQTKPKNIFFYVADNFFLIQIQVAENQKNED